MDELQVGDGGHLLRDQYPEQPAWKGDQYDYHHWFVVVGQLGIWSALKGDSLHRHIFVCDHLCVLVVVWVIKRFGQHTCVVMWMEFGGEWYLEGKSLMKALLAEIQ